MLDRHSPVTRPTLDGFIDRDIDWHIDRYHRSRPPIRHKFLRVCTNSTTLIDNIFTNKFSEYFACGNIVSDITDHFSQFCIFQSFIVTSQPAKITIPDYSKFSEQRYLQVLSQLHCESNEDMILALAGQFKQLSHEPEKFRWLNGIWTHDLCDAGAVL